MAAAPDLLPNRIPRALSAVAGAGLVVIGALVLAGWFVGGERLERLGLGLAPIQAITALGFVLCGLALGLLGRSSDLSRLRWAPVVLGALVATIGVLVLGDHLARGDLGIDRLLVRRGDEAPGRLAPLGGLGFLLVGLGLVLRGMRRAPRAAEALALVTSGIAFFALVGRLYGTQQLQGIAPYTWMPWLTAVAFLISLLGLLAMPPPGPLTTLLVSGDAAGVVARRLLPGAIILPVLLGWIRLIGSRAGLYGDELGVTFMVLASVVGFAGLIAWTAGTLQRRDRELRRLEQSFIQAQRMEVVGRLAGGVAHDFNNLLTPIMGYADLLLGRLGPGDPVRNELEEIRKAGERGAGLTRQLLAFSRKQVLQPRVVDLNALIRNIAELLRRLIGEDVSLDLVEGQDLWPVQADPGQMDQVLMNLAVNARDAMPGGGRLILETSNVVIARAYAYAHPEIEPGSYVMLAVSDTGVGMDESVQSHLFEPFFTTKERGKGTGLGLATVHGIVRQSHGHIWVYSELGRGTTFKISLPRAFTAATPAPGTPTARSALHGTETVLIAEDDWALRAFAVRALQAQGYTTLEAADGEEALDLAQRHSGPIDLVLTDVVMPGINGRELARRLEEMRTGLRVLFMSGHTDDAIVHHGVLEPGTLLLPKPFAAEDLARQVREALDGAAH